MQLVDEALFNTMVCTEAARLIAYAADSAVYGEEVASGRERLLEDSVDELHALHTLHRWDKVNDFVASFGRDWSSHRLLKIYKQLKLPEICIREEAWKSCQTDDAPCLGLDLVTDYRTWQDCLMGKSMPKTLAQNCMTHTEYLIRRSIRQLSKPEKLRYVQLVLDKDTAPEALTALAHTFELLDRQSTD